MKRAMIGLLAVLTVCSCGDNRQAADNTSGTKKESAVKAPTRVKTEVVDGAGITVNGQQQFVGIVEEREATAVVKRVVLNEGQAVSKGQLIAEMDDTQARNLLAGAEAQKNQANDALERYKMLHENGSLPEAQWVEIQSKVAQAQSQYEIAKKNLADCQLKAPVSGVIGKKLVGAGETALPSQAIVTILDISSVKVKVSIPEAEISGITASTPTTISVEAAQKQVSGGRIEKGIQADAFTHTYDVRINVPNGDGKLLPGMVASVRLTPNPSQDGEKSDYYLPVTAVQKKADGTLFVWTVAKDNTAHRTAVTTGNTQGNRIAISSGLESGQRVVTEGYQKLSEGTRVIY